MIMVIMSYGHGKDIDSIDDNNHNVHGNNIINTNDNDGGTDCSNAGGYSVIWGFNIEIDIYLVTLQSTMFKNAKEITIINVVCLV